MNTGIVMIGLALVMISAGLLVSPSHAAGPDNSCSPDSGIALFSEETLMDDHDAGTGMAGEGSGYRYSSAPGQVPVP
jgi:hypothetical protein